MAAVPSVRRRRLGAELRRLREQTGLNGEEAASALDWSASKLSRIENARIGARVSDVRLLLELYRVDEDHRGELLALAHAATEPGWWSGRRLATSPEFDEFVALEDEASAALCYSVFTVPGLVQSEPYAAATLRSAGLVTADSPRTIRRRVEMRMRRQDVLTRPDPIDFRGIVDESVLLRSIGDASVMFRQLQRLLELMRLPNVELRVLPLDGFHGPVMGEAFTILEFAPAYDVTFPDAVYIDSVWGSRVHTDDVAHLYRLSWEQLHAHALDPDASAACVARIADTVWK
ncbi:helix-turn-helix domain-containing protein [Actinomadura rupiterrae]|uniref:helix-turn-helix domain-containing protein n=1 Tax=Actinomadura rupiterrae TaxID=559627 RepID=UPI0020A4D63D|nr:helix-turn-helix transcriptional regulator [Actinomadura rupiterrae]MCP2343422.1 transcriptional regulator with XRE-family HTH domain [Actinomadura rupiterrae]